MNAPSNRPTPRGHRTVLAATLAAVLALAAPSGAISTPKGELRPSTVGDLLLTKRKPAYYNENWTYRVVLDGGMQLHLTFTYARLGPKSPVCGANLAVINFKGKSYWVGREYSEERFKQTASPFRLQVHPDIWMEGLPPAAHHVHFATTKHQGFFADLQFSQMIPGVVWGNGTFEVGEGDLILALPIPSAQVTGRIAVGRDTIQVNGQAAMSHIRQTEMASDMATDAFNYYQPGPSPLFCYFFKEKKGGWGGMAVGWKGSNAMLLDPQGINVVGGSPVPDRVDLMARNGVRASIQRKSTNQTVSILDEMEGFTRWIVKRIVGNVRFARGTASSESGSGIFEYMWAR